LVESEEDAVESYVAEPACSSKILWFKPCTALSNVWTLISKSLSEFCFSIVYNSDIIAIVIPIMPVTVPAIEKRLTQWNH